MMYHSFHNHTYLCKHAQGDVGDYVLAARQKGLRSIGISEHMPLPGGWWPKSRMDMEQLDGYVESVRRWGKAFPDITVFLAGECEWKPSWGDFFDQLLDKYAFDYLIGAPHWSPQEDGNWLGYTHLRTAQHLNNFSRHVQDIIEAGKFLFIAHPDVYLAGYTDWDNNTQACALDICRCAAAYKIPLEINANGMRKKMLTDSRGNARYSYPVRKFWEVAAQEGVEIVVGSDAHDPLEIVDSVEACFHWVHELGLKDVQDNLYKMLIAKM